MALYPHIYEELIVKPYKEGRRQLKVLSGYASSAFTHHILYEYQDLELDLIIGMTSAEPITIWNHNQYVKLSQETQRLRVRYYTGIPPIHAKALLWEGSLLSNRTAFIGSANFTWNGFKKQQELMVPADPNFVIRAFPKEKHLIDCTNPDVVDIIKIAYQKPSKSKKIDTQAVKKYKLYSENCINLSLLSSRNNEVPDRSGLNWGQRPGREPNQAYISIPRKIHRDYPGFFPDKKMEFTLITDDGESMICVVAQENNKAIETSHNNSILGRYFRTRLGVPLGAKVTKEHLLKYGRTDVTICKIDDETFLLDFSV